MIWVISWILCGLIGAAIAITSDERSTNPTRLEFLVCVLSGPIFLLASLYYWAEESEFWQKPMFKKRHD